MHLQKPLYHITLKLMKNIKYLFWVITLVFCLLTFYSFSSQAQGNVVAQVDTSYTGIKNVEIKARFCRVEVGAVNNTDKVSFFGEISGNQRRGNYKFMHEKVGNTLKVWVEGKSGFNIGISITSKSKMMFKVPKGTSVVVENTSGSVFGTGLSGAITHLAANSGSVKAQNINSPKVYVKASSGSVSAENINGSDVDFKTSSGSLKAENINGKRVDFKTSSGGLRVENVNGQTVTALSSSGGQRWTNVGGEFTTRASSGGIRIQGIKGNANVRTSSGTIRIANITGDLKAKANSGGIRLNNVKGALSLEATSGSIAGEDILLTGNSNFQSSSGGIKMGLKNDLKKLDFDLKAGSGSLRIGSERSGKRFVLKNGNSIVVKGISRSGSQKYVSFGSK